MPTIRKKNKKKGNTGLGGAVRGMLPNLGGEKKRGGARSRSNKRKAGMAGMAGVGRRGRRRRKRT